MRLFRILVYIGFVAVSVGAAVRFWIDALPSAEPFRAALPRIVSRGQEVVIAAEQPRTPAGTSRRSARPRRSPASPPRFTIVRSGSATASAAGTRNALTRPRPSAPPASTPTPAPKPPVAKPPTPTPTPAPPPATAPAAAPAATPSAPAPAPTVAAKPSRAKPKHAKKASAARAVSPQPSSPAATGSGEGSKPGKGKGDENHDHSGPPGQEKKNKP